MLEPARVSCMLWGPVSYRSSASSTPAVRRSQVSSTVLAYQLLPSLNVPRTVHAQSHAICFGMSVLNLEALLEGVCAYVYNLYIYTYIYIYVHANVAITCYHCPLELPSVSAAVAGSGICSTLGQNDRQKAVCTTCDHIPVRGGFEFGHRPTILSNLHQKQPHSAETRLLNAGSFSRFALGRTPTAPFPSSYPSAQLVHLGTQAFTADCIRLEMHVKHASKKKPCG